MKRTVFCLAFLCLLISQTAFAQENSVYIGANGGFNLSKFKFTEDLSELYPTTSGRLGINGGLVAGAVIQNWTISTGIQYIQKGGVYETNNFQTELGTGYFTAKERHHYISVPILFGYRHSLGDKVAVSFAMGPSLNFGLKGTLNETIEYFGSDQIDIQNYNVTFGDGVNEDFRPTQVGFQLSPGVVVNVGERAKLNFNVTWDMGTSDMFNPRYKDANSFFDTYTGNQLNRSTLFTVGYEYHFSFGDKY
ncbi:MAG: porin family protein [Bacteroidota bacterium]